MFKFRELVAAGAFVQRSNTTPSSFSNISVASASTFGGPIAGNAQIRGIATINSGTTVVSVAATGVVSGAAILSGIIQYGDVRTFNASRFITTAVMSVRAGAFEIVTVGSVAPLSDMPVGWFRID